MNYKEALFFIAKSLTISFEEKNRNEIGLILKTTNIDWETVVKVSTGHFVFCAMYCNLKKADFLKYLPKDLVGYMKNIADVNRNRNKQIISQALELNSILLANKITPIFIKGTGNLLANIYDDIAERMVGDIDFIFSNEDYPKAISILRDFGYSEVKKRDYYPPNESRHYRRLQKKNRIAAIEIHKHIIIKKYANEFNYRFVQRDCIFINKISVLSYANKLNLSIISSHINDDGFYYKTIALRNSYDVFLLSKKTNVKNAFNSLNKLSHPLNCFLAACYEIFNEPESLKYNPSAKIESYLSGFNSQFTNPIPKKRYTIFYKIYIFVKRIFFVLFKSISHVEYRVFLFKSLTDKNWYKQKLVQFGIKK